MGDFFDSICEDNPYGPWHDEALTECFMQTTVMNAVCVLFLIGGIARLIQASMHPNLGLREITKRDYFEFSLHVILVGLAIIALVGRFSVKDEYYWYQIVGDSRDITIWIVSGAVIIVECVRGINHHWVVTAFWVLELIVSSILFQTLLDGLLEIQDYEHIHEFVVWVLRLVATMLLAISGLWCNTESRPSEYKSLATFAHHSINNYGTDQTFAKLVENRPQDTRNIFSLLTFWWATPLLSLGNQRPLNHSDLYDISRQDKSEVLYNKFESAWNSQNRIVRRPSFAKALARTFWLKFWVAGIFKLIGDSSNFVGPIILNAIIDYISDKDAPVSKGLLLAAAMFGNYVVAAIFLALYNYEVFRIGAQAKNVVVTVVYRKSMTLSSAARQKSTVGEIVNYQAIDAQRLSMLIPFLHVLWTAPLQVGVALYMLYEFVGPASLAGVGVIILLFPLNIVIAKKQAGLQKMMLAEKDNRIKMTNEAISNIRVVKFFNWEESFFTNIANVRKNELKTLAKGYYLRAFTIFVMISTPVFVSIVTFATYVSLDNKLTPQVAFTSLALFNALRMPLQILPQVIGGLVEGKLSAKRLSNFLMSEEIDSHAVSTNDEYSADKDLAIRISGGSFSWNAKSDESSEQKPPTLSNLNFSVGKGELVAVVGAVGSGKSSLISALLGDIAKSSGNVLLKGKVSYVPQQPWVTNATVRDNILFGKAYEHSHYEECLRICQLQPDIEILPNRDLTEIGERGINLSGGQKQRISLARAAYQMSDVYLMDSPLSAVDVHVGKAIFDQLILGRLENTTRILVTHQLDILHRVDRIIVMQDGKIAEMGSYQDLMQPGKHLHDLVSRHISHNDIGGEGAEAAKTATESAKSDEKPKAGGKPGSGGPPGVGGGGGGPGRGGIITTEERGTGNVSWNVYKRYLQAAGGTTLLVMLAIAIASELGSRISNDWWLSFWTNESDAEKPKYSTNFFLIIYSAFGAAFSLCVLFRITSVFKGSISASKNLHDEILVKVLRSPTSFFDTTPVGRILNRFSKDMSGVDDTLPFSTAAFLGTSIFIVATAIIVCAVTPLFIVFVIPLAYLFYYIQQFYLKSSREIQRLESISRSPIFAQFSETLNGMSTIRAFGVVKNFITENDRKLDENMRAAFCTNAATRWLGFRLEFLCGCAIAAVSFFAVIDRGHTSPGLVGLSLTYIMNITGILNWLVRQSAEVETQLVCVERIAEYAELNEEGPYDVPQNKPPPSWPSSGAIELQELSVRYREGQNFVLHNLSCQIFPREKIGIVGRTGAGKSTIMLALFRMIEPAQGKILIDRVDITTIGLSDLRSRLSIIPQDPTLFIGSIRSNLDPFLQYDDAEVWDTLEKVHLKNFVSSLQAKLDAPVTENGENLSVGQRQLMCLGRALLRKSKILLMDEATASVDMETDALIQKTIRESFVDVTLLTIAHRVNTILDADRVMVLDKGSIVEFGTPEQLSENRNSIFYSILHESKISGIVH